MSVKKASVYLALLLLAGAAIMISVCFLLAEWFYLAFVIDFVSEGGLTSPSFTITAVPLFICPMLGGVLVLYLLWKGIFRLYRAVAKCVFREETER